MNYCDTVTSVEIVYYLMKFFYQYTDPLRAMYHQDDGLNSRMNYRTIGQWMSDFTNPNRPLRGSLDDNVSDVECGDSSLYSGSWPASLANGNWES